MSHPSKVFIFLAGILASAAAIAQDAAPQPAKSTTQSSPQVFTWNGPYAGVFGGGGWGQTHLKTNVGTVTPASYFTSTANINSVDRNGTGTRNPAMAIGGVKIGDNWLFNRLLLGLQLDLETFSFIATKNANNVTYPTLPAHYSMRTSISTNWLATARGRIGLTRSCRWPLIYISLGGAVSNIKVTNSFRDNTSNLGVGGGKSTDTKIGWTTGAGIEMPLNATWTVNGEYQYVAFGSVATHTNNNIGCTGSACPGTSPYATSARLRASIITLGLNYKLK